jgi:hypothetical protein
MSEGSSHTCDRGANHGGGLSGGKHPMYEDLDAPLSSNWPLLSISVTRLGSRDPSSSPKQTKHVDANENNPNWPPREYA